MSSREYVFWISCFLIFYNYFGYAVIARILSSFSRASGGKIVKDGGLPTVSFIVAAYNEEDCIREKINNTLSLPYPADKIEYIFVTDGSTDNTTGIIGSYPAISLMHSPGRNGKSTAVNRAVAAAKHDILIFSDANTILNRDAIVNIASHYIDSKVGGVAGEKKVATVTEDQHEVGQGEGLYWKYESALKQIDSDFYSVVGAAGELFSVRRSLYDPVAEDVILDDFVISLKIAQKGFRVVYDATSFATELPSFSINDEQKRKIRIAAGGFQSMVILKSLFRFWNHPRLSFLYISHRVMRWTTSPLCLITAYIANGAILFENRSLVYQLSFGLQTCFYLAAILASFSARCSKIKLIKLSYYFTFMNTSVILGFLRFIKGNQSAAWEKARRAPGKTSL